MKFCLSGSDEYSKVNNRGYRLQERLYGQSHERIGFLTTLKPSG